jgi:type VI secretion system protein ImpA
MASSEVLDFGALLAPIPGDKPTGADLRADPSPTSPYYAIKDARNGARAAERQIMLDGEADAKPVDWRPVVQHGTKVLSEKAKDLEVAAYLIEGLVRVKGFPGLRDGFRLIREMCEQYWDDLFPQPDEEGLETRVAPLTGLNGDEAEGTLIGPITKVALTQGSTGPYAYYHYQQAMALKQVEDPEARQKRIQQGAVSLDMVEKAVSETPNPFFAELVGELKECQDEFARLCGVLDDKCGSKAPPASNIRGALERCLEAIQHIARSKLPSAAAAGEPAPDGEAAAGDGAVAAAGAAVPGQAVGILRNRDDAFEMLLKVADFFRRTEPHTPISYALEQAVRWGRMTLPELLNELIPDDGARRHFFRQVGIRGEESSG